jgi:flagellar hook-associated protein 2
LVTGYKIALKEVGSSDVVVKQDRESIMGKVDSFVEKYNATISELNRQTKSSTDATERGIFSSDSSITRMKSSIENMLKNISGGVGSMEDYGFEVDKEGKLSVNKDTLNTQIDTNAENVKAFFTGGDFTDSDGTTTTITGAFVDFSDNVGGYTKYNGILDQFKTNLTDDTKRLEESKTTATERLDSKYEIMKKQYAAYDAMIAKLNNASSMFTSMANAQTASQN